MRLGDLLDAWVFRGVVDVGTGSRDGVSVEQELRMEHKYPDKYPDKYQQYEYDERLAICLAEGVPEDRAREIAAAQVEPVQGKIWEQPRVYE